MPVSTCALRVPRLAGFVGSSERGGVRKTKQEQGVTAFGAAAAKHWHRPPWPGHNIDDAKQK